MRDKLIEVANFPTPNDADILESLFQEEGINYLLENQNSSGVIPGVETRLLVREEDVTRAVNLIKRSGFESFLSDFNYK